LNKIAKSSYLLPQCLPDLLDTGKRLLLSGHFLGYVELRPDVREPNTNEKNDTTSVTSIRFKIENGKKGDRFLYEIKTRGRARARIPKQPKVK
jgi:hypothetical protein